MQRDWRRTIIAFLVFVAWAATTVFASRLWAPDPGTQGLDESVSGAVQVSFVLAIAVLVAAIVVFRWTDVGLNPPTPRRSLRLLWFPSLYVVLFVALALFAGVPPLPVLLVILVNTVLVGISEELACRGVLYTGLRASFGAWPAILGSTLLFGAIHVLNGFTTGSFLAASIQAVTAFMTGIAFMAIRFRTRSLYPGMVLHMLWNFALVSAAVGLSTRFNVDSGTPPPEGITLWIVALPIALIVPNFLYGLYLLRHASRDEAAA